MKVSLGALRHIPALWGRRLRRPTNKAKALRSARNYANHGSE